MRPYYEQQEHKTAEQEVLDYLYDRFPRFLFSPFKKRGAPWDAFCCHRKDGEFTIRSIIEIKCRSNDFYTYPTYLISQKKLKKMQEFCRTFGGIERWLGPSTKCMPIKAVLVVRFQDCVATCDVSTKRDSWIESYGGRSDREDKWDKEEIYEIPIQEFKRI